MSRDWERHLDRWTNAALLDAESANRIRAWESAQTPAEGLSWQVRIALAFGAVLLAAGVLLFVSAHWNEISPDARLSLVVAMVAALHAGGAAVARRFANMAVALHAAGSVALGAAIALAGQIYNLSEHWPGAVLLWAIGCAITWAILKHWTQGALCAILFPWWLTGEWDVWISQAQAMMPVWVGICALSFVYLGARSSAGDGPFRKALMWIGGLALLPAAAVAASYPSWNPNQIADHLVRNGIGSWTYWAALAVAVAVPLLVALAINRMQAGWNALAIAWTVSLALVGTEMRGTWAPYLWCAIGSVGLAAWGIRDGRAERVNLGVAGFALTALIFYFSNVMDKLGRSVSLIGMGLLFLAGGWLLEKARRRMLARMREVL